MSHIEKELLPEDAVALKDAAIDRKVDKVVEILKRAGTAKRARAHVVIEHFLIAGLHSADKISDVTIDVVLNKTFAVTLV